MAILFDDENRTPSPVLDHPASRGIPLVGGGLLELVLFFAAFWVIDTYAVTDRSLLDFRPHPFWIPVMLLSLQYGAVQGLVAAAAAVGVLFVLQPPGQAIGEDYFAFWLRAWFEPSLWVVAALVLGEIRYTQISERDDLRSEVAHAERKAQALSAASRELMIRIAKLERQIAGGGSLITSEAHSAIVDFYRVTAENFSDKLSRHISVLLGDVEFGLTLGVGNPHASIQPIGDTIGGASGNEVAFQAVLNELRRKPRVLCVANAGDGPLEDLRAVFVAPIVHPGTNNLIGTLAIGRFRGTTVTSDIEEHIGILCRTIGVVVCRIWPALGDEPPARSISGERAIWMLPVPAAPSVPVALRDEIQTFHRRIRGPKEGKLKVKRRKRHS